MHSVYTISRFAKSLIIAASCVMIAGCTALDRLSEIGDAPPLSTIENPTAQAGYKPVSMPMPAPLPNTREVNSLWRAGSRSFFKDQRAGRVGDILTVTVDISDSAKLDNSTERTRDNSEKAGVPNLFGLEAELGKKLPNAVSATSLLNTNSSVKNKGDGAIDRKEAIKVKVAAVVSQVLPNGNLVISGRQEIRINFEVRELLVSGIIRPEDISSVNSISSEKIAEARISYGGRGQITDVQQPRYGSQVMDVLLPF